MGINPVGNTQKVQKTVVTDLLDFRELSIHKSNKIVTKNFTAFITGSEPSIARLCTFLIFESGRNNVIEFNTHLLVKYGKYLKAVQKKFGLKETKHKNSSLPVSRKNFQLLISTGILIPIDIKKKMFLINPALVYHQNCYNEQATYMKHYEDFYSKWATGLYDKPNLHSSMVLLAREYYNACIYK